MSTATKIATSTPPSFGRLAFAVTLTGALIGAIVVATIVTSAFTGFDRALQVFGYVSFPMSTLLSPTLESILPFDLEDPIGGAVPVLVSAWVQASLIATLIIGAAWAVLARIRA